MKQRFVIFILFLIACVSSTPASSPKGVAFASLPVLTWGGDLVGSTNTAQTVSGLHGVAVPSQTPTTSSVLLATGTNTSTWVDPNAGAIQQPFSLPMTHKVRWMSGEANAFNVGTLTAGLHYSGFSSLSVNSSTTHPAASTASKLGATSRLRFAQTVATASAGVFEGGYVNAGVAQIGPWRGNAANRGGFLFRTRIAMSQIGVSSTIHVLIGLVEGTGWGATTDWTTDATLSKVGIGFTATTTAGGAFPVADWQAIESAHNTPHLTDLGANYALTVNQFLEVILYAAPNDTKVTLVVNDITSGTATNTITQTLNTNLPPNTTFLLPVINMATQTITSGTNSLDMSILYLETFDG